MAAFRWVLLDESDAEMRSSESFASQPEAESWLTSNWRELADEGTASVSLRAEEDVVYTMRLAPE
jgi:hypothetical protein